MAAYVFIVVAGISTVSVVGAMARRIAGSAGARRIRVSGPGGGKVVEIGTPDTDPGQQEAVAQLAAEIESLRDEVTGLRREMDEAQNRLDFTERLLGQARERGLLNPPKEH